MKKDKPLKITKKSENFCYEVKLPASFFSQNALRVVKKLQQAGYQAYLIGGCVRDTLLGTEPKDFDVATNARPDQIKEVFSNSRIIGKRFLLAHILFRNEIIEVATFRAPQRKSKNLKILADDNTFGTIEQDVQRRDFTLNALYYDPLTSTIVDQVGGLEDLERGSIRMIGNPLVRFQEDPVRMIRAVRYAAKLGLFIDLEVKEALYKKGSLILHVPRARLLEEFCKCFTQPKAGDILKLMHHFKLARFLVPREVLKDSLIKRLSRCFKIISSYNLGRESQLILLWTSLYFAYKTTLPKHKQSHALNSFLEKLSHLILVPKQLEALTKKAIHAHSSKSKPRGALRQYSSTLNLVGKVEKQFSSWF